MPRPLIRGSAGIVLALVLAAGPSVAARRHAPGAEWVPLDRGDPRLTVKGDRATFTARALTFEIELLDGPRRMLFLKSAGLGGHDPYDAAGLGFEALTFLVRLDNRSDETVVMRPQNFFLITRRPVSHNTPCDYSCLVAISERAGFDRAGEKQVLASALDASETIRAGGRLSKLLVFTDIPDAFRGFVLDLDMISVGSEQVRFVLPYAVVQAEKP